MKLIIRSITLFIIGCFLYKCYLYNSDKFIETLYLFGAVIIFYGLIFLNISISGNDEK